MTSQSKKIYLYLLNAILFITLLYAVISRIWVAEDAYISFRYILNLVEGKGLVFNSGERIEGFTHPYWLFLVTLLHILGIPFHQGSICLGVLFTFLGSYFFIKSLKRNSPYLLIFPSVLISQEGFRDFATSGLEFSLTYFLLSILIPLNYNKQLEYPFLTGMLSSLLYHTRPEMGLLIPFFFIWRIYEVKKFEFNWVLRYGFAVFLFAIVYHIFRYSYFDDIFPNTFYAKSGSGSRYYDGLKYLFHFIYYSKFSVLTFIIGFTLILRYFNKNPEKSKILSNIPIRELLMTFLISFYIIRVGGDFMGFRLLLPYYVIFLYCFDRYTNQYYFLFIQEKSITIINILLVIICLGLVIDRTNYPLVDKTGIVNERKAYTKDVYNTLKDRFQGIKYEWYLRGKEFNELQKCLGVNNFIITNSITDAKCTEKGFGLGYFSVAAGVNVLVIDELGLTDREVAKSGIKSDHERVGHERSISLEKVIERRAAFCSLEDERYDIIMKTKYGVILRIDQDFLHSLGKDEYEQKVRGLKDLKARISKSNLSRDIILLNRLILLESAFGQKIESLAETYISKQGMNLERCWK